jgi:chromosome partitioning protein
MLVLSNKGRTNPPVLSWLAMRRGGSGKSTTAVHVAIALLKAGQRVATIDLDSRQNSFTHYIENRRSWAKRNRLDLERPTHFYVDRVEGVRADENEAAEFSSFAHTIAEIEHSHDFVLIDTPGTDAYLMQRAHAMAITLITPLNDSFVDFDVLGTVDPQRYALTGISHYAERCARRATSAARWTRRTPTGSWSAIASPLSGRATSG